MFSKSKPDILFLIAARLDSGRNKGAPQLNKDIRVLKKAESEIVRLRKEIIKFKALINSQ